MQHGQGRTGDTNWWTTDATVAGGLNSSENSSSKLFSVLSPPLKRSVLGLVNPLGSIWLVEMRKSVATVLGLSLKSSGIVSPITPLGFLREGLRATDLGCGESWEAGSPRCVGTQGSVQVIRQRRQSSGHPPLDQPMLWDVERGSSLQSSARTPSKAQRPRV